LSKCLENQVIPSNFKLRNALPGNKNINQEKLNKISFETIKDEKQRHANILIGAEAEFNKSKNKLKNFFDEETVISELSRLDKHLKNVEKLNLKSKDKKFNNLLGDPLPDIPDVTLASDDENHSNAHKQKKKRKFKRRYLQPQPKKSRRRKRSNVVENNSENIENHWNGVIKNFSGEAVTEVEEKLFMKGKKFCPVELDPPVVRFQKELDAFF
jgi:hypothetical protein